MVISMADEPLEEEKILLHVLVESLASPAIIVNEALARATPCKCYPIGDDKKLCFSKGAIGALDQEQRKLYCTQEIDVSDGGIVERVKIFRECAKEAKKEIEDIPRGERLQPWLTAMGQCLRARGIEI